MKETKNYISYVLIVIIIALLFYALHLEEKIGELNQQVSDSSETEQSENREIDLSSIEEKLNSIENYIDEMSNKVDTLYEKIIPENERGEILEVNKEDTSQGN